MIGLWIAVMAISAVRFGNKLHKTGDDAVFGATADFILFALGGIGVYMA